MDLVLVNPSDRERAYGELSSSIAAIEPPFWAGLIASYLRNKYSVAILDADTNGWSIERTVAEILKLDPVLVVIVVQGANPSASSTPKMIAANKLSKELRRQSLVFIAMAGIHPSALPEFTLLESNADYICVGEPFYTIRELLEVCVAHPNIRGISYRMLDNMGCLCFVHKGKSNPLKETDFPVFPWDTIDMSKYRCHNWQALDNLDNRSPYGVIYTSMGCPFNCSYCNIHAFFSDREIRYRNIDSILSELNTLAKIYKVYYIKIMDEMFALNEKRVIELCDEIAKRDYGFNMWAYARVDTVTKPMLQSMKRAGIEWLGYGFESGSELVRKSVNKKFKQSQMDKVIDMTREAGINIMANFIFGLSEDTLETMQFTLDTAIKHNFEYINFYCAMAYPGSQLYDDCIKQGIKLSDNWATYSQLGYETEPLGSKYLTPVQVLAFRDDAFNKYFNRPEYFIMIENKFGEKAVEHIQEMLKHKIRRKILED